MTIVSKSLGRLRRMTLPIAAMATYDRVDAADGCSVIFSPAELDSGIGGADVLVAGRLDGRRIAENLGPVWLVAPHDKRPACWVRMLGSTTVVKVSAEFRAVLVDRSAPNCQKNTHATREVLRSRHRSIGPGISIP